MISARKRVVFDTSSLVPACLYPDREPAHIFRRALLAHDVFASTATFNELAAVLARDIFNAWQPLDRRLMWVHLLHESVVWAEPTTPVTDCRDPKDNKFLELALAAQADVLVSSDIHLLEMHPFRAIPVLALADFGQQFLTTP